MNVAEILEAVQLPVAITPMNEEFEQLYHRDSVGVISEVSMSATQTSGDDLIQSAAKSAGILPNVTVMNTDITTPKLRVTQVLLSSTINASTPALPVSMTREATTTMTQPVTAVKATSAPVPVTSKSANEPLTSIVAMSQPNLLLHVDIDVEELTDSDLENDVPDYLKDSDGDLRRHNDKDTQWVTLSFRNTKVLYQSVTPNLKSNC